jgi:hypothetical protein
MSFEIIAMDPQDGWGIVKQEIEPKIYFLIKPPHTLNEWTQIAPTDLVKLIRLCPAVPKTETSHLSKEEVNEKISGIYKKYHEIIESN